MKHGFGGCKNASAMFLENIALFPHENSADVNAGLFEQMQILLAGRYWQKLAWEKG